MQQLELIFNDSRLPRAPYSTDDLADGLSIRQLKSAMRRKYIQINPPKLQFWLCLDVDRERGGLAWEEAGLAMPNFATVNPENAHAHLVWGLEAPVLTTEAARQHPLRYLNALRVAYTELTDADRGYSGLITKNPNHAAWRTFWGHGHLFSLGELAEYVREPLKKYKDSRPADEVGIGRNVALFDHLRKWAYREVRLYRGEGRKHFDVWHKDVRDQAEKRNGDFKDPLPYSEVKATAKSVAKWVWQKDPIAESRFKSRQAERGRMPAKEGSKPRGRPAIVGKPWEDLGISRRTWYRRQSGLIVPDKSNLVLPVDNSRN
ncbi:MAG: replication initiation protein [Porticoccaceae bacterium]